MSFLGCGNYGILATRQPAYSRTNIRTKTVHLPPNMVFALQSHYSNFCKPDRTITHSLEHSRVRTRSKR